MPKPGDGPGHDELDGLLHAVLGRAVATLDPGWRMHDLRPRLDSGAAEQPAAISVVLIHAEYGVALVDVLPRIGPADQPVKRVEAMRRLLKAGGLKASLLRRLPIVHLLVTPERTDRLEEILGYAFSWQPPMNPAEDAKWAEQAARIIMRDAEDGSRAASATEALSRIAPASPLPRWLRPIRVAAWMQRG